jgi:NADH dehydrogenase FAD-containing subunit
MAETVSAAATTPETKEIVVLGASQAGLPTTHYILRHVVPHVKNAHVTLVDPNAEGSWFQRVGSPRAIVPGDKLSLDKVFLPISDGFKEYPQDKLTLLQGKATSLDYTARSVAVAKGDGSTHVINYYALVIATGATSPSPLLGVQSTDTLSKEAIEAFRKKLPEVKSIVIAGGGPAGVETAGELGHFLNGQAGFFASKPSSIKTKITLVTAADKLLPVLRPALAKRAETLLAKVGVDVVYNTKVQSTVPETAGVLDTQGGLSTLLEPAKVALSNGETLEADLFIPAWGVKPNSSWLPKDLLDDTGRIETNQSTLRVERAGPRVYALGDVANYGRGGAIELMDALPVLNVNLKRDLLHGEKEWSTETTEVPKTGEDKLFEKIGESQLVPISTLGGVGAVSGYRIPSFAVWLIKVSHCGQIYVPYCTARFL